MNRRHLRWLIRVYAAILALFFVASLTAATYAWFTSNKTVTTSRIEARVAEENVELLLSTTGGASFRGDGVCELKQVNAFDSEQLMPVSTADLNTFMCNVNNGVDATAFSVVQNESGYYHGRVYMMAKSSGDLQSGSIALYLDGTRSGAITAQNTGGGKMLNAARLGLSFRGGAAAILSLSESQNAAADRSNNTVLNGERLPAGMVLDGTGGEIKAVRDPAIPVERRTVGADGKIPEQPLANLQLNRIYQLDVYFYLEGCDPDCTGAIRFEGADLQLAFFGVLNEGA